MMYTGKLIIQKYFRSVVQRVSFLYQPGINPARYIRPILNFSHHIILAETFVMLNLKYLVSA